MAKTIDITLQIEKNYFDNTTIPQPSVPNEPINEIIKFKFKNKQELHTYIGKLYEEYVKFNDPETSLIAELLGKIAKQVK